ncbi:MULTISPECIES: lipopolysaccharide transport periplasmic protein LptA [Pseudomonas]|jgi:lipopolysaccharide export system protein LptA|uniref:lipopolysaccharide transport periplasmic protein LptA n=1 Tax=Pseudomonas TaxID=286 RepID=UPI000789C55F|nr:MULTISPECIES: lipopolysaccharide transport periplasmic protein LptA [Pseudomonas]AMS18301.1 lipopolysaccharide transport periplasmic protein LptA [Pseudomonas chlororaphis]WDG52897.1 lipopolysaccharide transport periplasmic protein LptA [Pseudomonas chlororaphis]WDH86081.1 lipopolysaccharide transport periplasmic protein LptA [Pseudomonas chlororaphis]WPO48242.1 lipopolysaccharide transport periplasmic protein LptA [Pseudomonas sp. S1Bt23]
MRFVKTFPILLGLGIALGSMNAWGLPNDSEQLIRVQADRSQIDNKQGFATYTGNVIITQGSMKITGDTVTIVMKKGSHNEVDVVTSVGNLAYFEQLQKATDPQPVQAYAVTIQYLTQQNRIILIDRAKVISAGNTTLGEKIVYDTVKQIASVGRATGSQITESRPRVNMVIRPNKKDEMQRAQ